MQMMVSAADDGVNAEAVAPGPGCVDCEQTGGWWVHLRRCAACGHVGCCDTSPQQHATGHHQSTGHPLVQSYEPGEDWFYDYRTGALLAGPDLAPPVSRPSSQPVPGPAGRVPSDWRERIHQ